MKPSATNASALLCIGKLASINPSIHAMSPSEQVKLMLCPTTPKATTLVNKFIAIMFKARCNIDNGDHSTNLTFPPHVENYSCPNISLDASFSTVASSSSFYSEIFSESDTE